MLFFWGLLFSLALFAPHSGQAASIENFNSRLDIKSDGAVYVTETIVYDFGSEQKHGIYRVIPVKYQRNGLNYSLGFSFERVTDEQGRSYKANVTNVGAYWEMKVGDPDILVSGKKFYVFQYTVTDAINFFSDHDELYWNTTGNGWKVEIQTASAQVTLPVAVSALAVTKACFAGTLGGTDPCSGFTVNVDANEKADTVTFHHDGFLDVGQGLTIVIGFPKGLIKEPSLTRTVIKTILDNKIFFLPLTVFFALLYYWYTRGRDPEGRGTVVVQYEAPEGLVPAEVGTIIDEHADNYDISAEVINLAVKGYLKITRLEKKEFIFGTTVDYEFERIKSSVPLGSEVEGELLRKLFKRRSKSSVASILDSGSYEPLSSVRLSDLKDQFSKDLAELKKIVYGMVTRKGYFVQNPETVRNMFFIGGGVVVVFGFLFGHIWGASGLWSLILSGALAFIFGFVMPKKTQKGVAAKEYILGLKTYLSVAEKERIEFHNAPEKSPKLFEKLLPYAMVLKVENVWGAQFADLYKDSAPGWYVNGAGQAFIFSSFMSDLGNFSKATGTTLAAVPGGAGSGGSGFGGGGFSGGGFGGGGGGSW